MDVIFLVKLVGPFLKSSTGHRLPKTDLNHDNIQVKNNLTKANWERNSDMKIHLLFQTFTNGELGCIKYISAVCH